MALRIPFLLLLQRACCIAASIAAPTLQVEDSTPLTNSALWPDQFSLDVVPVKRVQPRLSENSILVNGLETMQWISAQQFTERFDFGPDQQSSVKSRSFIADEFWDTYIRIEDGSESLENRFAIWGVMALLQAQAQAETSGERRVSYVDMFWSKRTVGRVYLGKNRPGLTAGNNTSDRDQRAETDDDPMGVLPDTEISKATGVSVIGNDAASAPQLEVRILNFGFGDLSTRQLILPACAALIQLAAARDKTQSPPQINTYIPLTDSGLSYGGTSQSDWTYTTAAKGLVLMARRFIRNPTRKEVLMSLIVGKRRAAIANFLRRDPKPPA